jgi:hypothetical protein
MKFKGTTRKLAGVVCATALVAGLAGAVSPAAPAAAAFEVAAGWGEVRHAHCSFGLADAE